MDFYFLISYYIIKNAVYSGTGGRKN